MVILITIIIILLAIISVQCRVIVQLKKINSASSKSLMRLSLLYGQVLSENNTLREILHGREIV